MKKNVFFIVVDSFLAGKVGDKKNSNSPTPFLDELKKKSIYCTNMYSQGPHTEAGSRALLTGCDSMDYGGYMHNLYEAKCTYLDVFKANGYKVFDFFLPYYLYSYREFKNIDYQYFTSDFLYESVWEHRLLRFAKIREIRPLTELERYDAKKQLELTFIAWLNFYEKWYEGEKSCFLGLKALCSDFDWDSNYELLKSEEAAFRNAPDSYLDNILDEGTNCNLYKIRRFCFTDFLNQDFIDEHVFAKHKDFFAMLRKKQFVKTIKNSKINYRKLGGSLFTSIKSRSLTGYLKQLVYALACSEISRGYTKNHFYQTLPSMRMILRTALSEISEKSQNSPVLLHCHPEELHNRFNYFSFDINDAELINHEFDLFKDYLQSVKSDYSGNLLYDCALLYVDDCIKEFYNALNKRGLLENSIIVVCADHGSSYGCNPIREKINDCHTENYHIPLWIFDGSNPNGFVNEKYHTSKDILATVYKLCGFTDIENITGEPITEQSGGDIAVSEQTGGGCPDIRTRPIEFIARNKKYLVHYDVRAFEDFSNGKLKEVYDLENDPLELTNIVDRVDVNSISDILAELRKRKAQIAESYRSLHPSFDYEPYKSIEGINI